mmetsp:Transcript_8956/g.12976  ORF Transcript_8956/g.12976 Transcript_8956/m.12976 type:complete len:164 (-) Transcript_8956:987-1478(-)
MSRAGTSTESAGGFGPLLDLSTKGFGAVSGRLGCKKAVLVLTSFGAGGGADGNGRRLVGGAYEGGAAWNAGGCVLAGPEGLGYERTGEADELYRGAGGYFGGGGSKDAFEPILRTGKAFATTAGAGFAAETAFFCAATRISVLVRTSFPSNEMIAAAASEFAV